MIDERATALRKAMVRAIGCLNQANQTYQVQRAHRELSDALDRDLDSYPDGQDAQLRAREGRRRHLAQRSFAP